MTTTKQRADLTFKHNIKKERHGWLRLTPAYSLKIVDTVLSENSTRGKVLDPFSGTGTTALCAATFGHEAIAVDINPFLVWLGNAKLAHYSKESIIKAGKLADEVVAYAQDSSATPVPPPPISNIERWWGCEQLEVLCRLKAGIDQVESESGAARDLLLIAFCRLVIAMSNAAFNHQSMSFKQHVQSGHKQLSIFDGDSPLANSYAVELAATLDGASKNPPANGTVLLGDSRDLNVLEEDAVDLVITSPPYPNRMSYIRELRPYMYWLGYLVEAREAAEMDWEAIGGTWGNATAWLKDWKVAQDTFLPEHLFRTMQRVSESSAKSGKVLASYIGRYFEGMWQHFKALRPKLTSGAEIHYIIGNSKFYGEIVAADSIFEDMLTELGYVDVGSRVLRKRNSKKELYEYEVVARNP